ncbi:MAG: LysR family transcriptional regulator [Verrucomicrobiota bacterium]|jgi:DNA-binding transcriptional LysR family regulator|nr:LysR family transcriptional regulator [Verrucomicrobiota bacterium]MEC8656904.1 LysR family transcriptional regulator [Verrucomicrobiota bacterium]MEC8789978.1 LysR family transcriptional regulator [Verrucomicrobiota bacterium]MEC8865485.1 LysR family transcriptional regulator [Verrucomicrobiota bacterium]
MHIQNFKTFCDLVETKSFSKAARLNEVTQSAVSQQLKAMEAHYDMLIIDRNQKKFRLTPQGTALYSTFKEILDLYEKLNCEIQEMRNIVSGTIQISTVNSIGLHELPPYLKSFIKQFPSVNARVEYRRANLVYEDVLHGNADLGLVAFPPPHKDLTIIPFANDELIIVMSPEHRLTKKRSISMNDLSGVEFVAFERDIPTRKATDEILAKAGVEVQVVMEFDNVETVKRAIEINAGIAILPASTVITESERNQLVIYKLEGGIHNRPLAVIHKKNRILTPALRSFVELMQNGEEE